MMTGPWGNLGFRDEGGYYVAYWTPIAPGSFMGAVELGRVLSAAVRDEVRKRAFVDFMADICGAQAKILFERRDELAARREHDGDE